MAEARLHIPPARDGAIPQQLRARGCRCALLAFAFGFQPEFVRVIAVPGFSVPREGVAGVRVAPFEAVEQEFAGGAGVVHFHFARHRAIRHGVVVLRCRRVGRDVLLLALRGLAGCGGRRRWHVLMMLMIHAWHRRVGCRRRRRWRGVVMVFLRGGRGCEQHQRGGREYRRTQCAHEWCSAEPASCATTTSRNMPASM